MTSYAIETQGVSFEWDGTLVGEIVSFNGPGGSASVIDVTHLGSDRREKLMGIADEGQISFDMNLVPADAGQVKLRADRASRTKRTARLFLTDGSGTILTFDAYCTQFSISGSVDNKVSVSITLEISEEVNWSPRLTIFTPYAPATGIIVLDLEEDTLHADSETTTNWTWGYDGSDLVIATVVRTSASRATITYNIAAEIPGDYTLTIQAKAAALTGVFPSGILSTDITISA